MGVALGTIPFPHRERQFAHDMSTTMTPLRTGKPLINLSEIASVPVRFVFQLTERFPPTGITNRLSQLVIAEHPFNIQRLNRDDLVFAHQLSRDLVQIVLADVGNFLVLFG
jgi:hypothetical protein